MITNLDLLSRLIGPTMFEGFDCKGLAAAWHARQQLQERVCEHAPGTALKRIKGIKSEALNDPSAANYKRLAEAELDGEKAEEKIRALRRVVKQELRDFQSETYAPLSLKLCEHVIQKARQAISSLRTLEEEFAAKLGVEYAPGPIVCAVDAAMEAQMRIGSSGADDPIRFFADSRMAPARLMSELVHQFE